MCVCVLGAVTKKKNTTSGEQQRLRRRCDMIALHVAQMYICRCVHAACALHSMLCCTYVLRLAAAARCAGDYAIATGGKRVLGKRMLGGREFWRRECWVRGQESAGEEGDHAMFPGRPLMHIPPRMLPRGFAQMKYERLGKKSCTGTDMEEDTSMADTDTDSYASLDLMD